MKFIPEHRVLPVRWILLFLGVISWGAHAAIVIDPWLPIFKGVEMAHGEADASEPILQKVTVVRVDLQDPDVYFFSTPTDEKGGLETLSQTTSQFLTTYGLQIAINANFFSPCCSGTSEPKELIGLAMSEGEVVSPPVFSGTGSQALLITEDNVASIASTTVSFNPDNYWTAVAGSDWVVQNGTVRTNYPTSDFYTNTHPRSAVGVSQNGRYLILMTIDGRQPGYSVGAPMGDVARWLSRFGVYNGINLDGGGSTTLVMDDEGEAIELNSPSGSAQRMLGNSLGLWALPLPLTIVEAPQNQTVFIQQSVTFTTDAVGPKPINYQWQFNGTNISGATARTYVIPSADLVHAGDYTVIVSNPNETNVLTAHLTVTDEIIITSGEANLLGNWTVTTSGAEKFAESYFYIPTTANPSPNAEAFYRPNIPVAGQWDVFIWYSGGASRSTNVPVFTLYDGGIKFTNLNQSVGGGQWVPLGSRLDFVQGTAGYVRFANNTGESNRLVIADAVRFRFRPNPPELVQLSEFNITNGVFHVVLNGESGIRHTIEASTNLLNWTTLTNFVMPEAGFEFTDSQGTGFSRRFYRTKVAP